MYPLDKLEKGMLVIICDDLTEDDRPAYSDGYSEFGYRPSKPKTLPFNGKPWRVVALSLPFVLVTDGNHKISIDTRKWGLSIASKLYAKEWEEAEQESMFETHKSKKSSGSLVSRRRKKEKPDPNACPRCKLRMRLRRVGLGEWRRVCDICGHQGPEENTP